MSVNDHRKTSYCASYPFHVSPHRHGYGDTDTLHTRPLVNSDQVSNPHSSQKPLPIPPPIPEPNSLLFSSRDVVSLGLEDSRTGNPNHVLRQTDQFPSEQVPPGRHGRRMSENVRNCPAVSNFWESQTQPVGPPRVCHENRLFS